MHSIWERGLRYTVHCLKQSRIAAQAAFRISQLPVYSTIPSSLNRGLPFCHIVNLIVVVSWAITIVYDVICALVWDNHTFLKAR